MLELLVAAPAADYVGPLGQAGVGAEIVGAAVVRLCGDCELLQLQLLALMLAARWHGAGRAAVAAAATHLSERKIQDSGRGNKWQQILKGLAKAQLYLE